MEPLVVEITSWSRPYDDITTITVDSIISSEYTYFCWPSGEYSSCTEGPKDLSWGYYLYVVDAYSSGSFPNRTETKEPH